MRKLDLSEFIKTGDLVFDVGANVGSKTEMYLSLGATVVCFEPNYLAAISLLEKFWNHPRVCIELVGLCDRETTLEFFPAKLTAQSTFAIEIASGILSAPSDHWGVPKLMHVTTLEKMFGIWGLPTFVKIDVESFEPHVIKGMKTPVPSLSFEFNPTVPSNYEECLKRLTQLGYERFDYVVNHTVDGVGIESDEYRFDDWVDLDALVRALREEPRQPGDNWGDVYARWDG